MHSTICVSVYTSLYSIGSEYGSATELKTGCEVPVAINHNFTTSAASLEARG